MSNVIRKWTEPCRIHLGFEDRPNTFEVHDWETKPTSIEQAKYLKRIIAPIRQVCTVLKSKNARSRKLAVLVPEIAVPAPRGRVPRRSES
jgi:hypothetical protein